MRIVTKNNIPAVLQSWKRLRKDYRGAIASGLNKTAFRVARKDMPGIMREGIDRPVRFTEKSPAYYKKADQRRLVALVGIKDIQAKYLERIIFGGRGERGKAVPVKIRLNKFGNIARLKDGAKVKELLSRPNHFAKTINGVSGIWRKTAKRIELLVYFSQGTYTYRKQFAWHKAVIKAANKQLPRAMDEAVNKAVARVTSRAVVNVL